MTVTSDMAAPLTAWERWMYGGAGALAPIFLAGATIDGHTFEQHFDFAVYQGLLCRTICLLVVGGFVVFLHQRENEPWRAFVMGVSAPALLTTLIAGTQMTASQVTSPAAQVAPSTSKGIPPAPQGSSSLNRFRLVSTALVADNTPSPDIYPICLPRRSVAIRFLSGFFGTATSTTDLWWLVSAPFSSKEEAINAYLFYQRAVVEAGLNPRVFSIPKGQYLLALDINLTEVGALKSALKLSTSNASVPISPKRFGALLEALKIDPSNLETCHFQVSAH